MAIERFNLYDPDLGEEDLFNLRFDEWRKLEDFFDESVCYPEIGAGSYDEYGEIDPSMSFALVGSSSPLSIFNATGDGCGVFIVRDGSLASYIGNLHGTNNQWYFGYRTKNGIMIIIRDMVNEVNSGVLVIGKTNNGAPAFLGASATELRHASALNAHVASSDDLSLFEEGQKVGLSFLPETETAYANIRSGQVSQTVLCPVPTHGEDDKISYIQGLYCMPWSQFRGREGSIILHGRTYATNGYYALLDE